MPQPKIFINVPMDEANRSRIEREEHFWTAPRLVGLTFVTLGIALVVLYMMAQVESETYWDNWIDPAGTHNELEWENE